MKYTIAMLNFYSHDVLIVGISIEIIDEGGKHDDQCHFNYNFMQHIVLNWWENLEDVGKWLPTWKSMISRFFIQLFLLEFFKWTMDIIELSRSIRSWFDWWLVAWFERIPANPESSQHPKLFWKFQWKNI
jgi:hypothetical protein